MLGIYVYEGWEVEFVDERYDNCSGDSEVRIMDKR